MTYHTARTHTYPFNGPFSGTTRVGRYQKGKANLDFTEVKDKSVAVASAGPYASLHLAPVQTDNNASTSPLSFLQVGCPSCRPTNSVN